MYVLCSEICPPTVFWFALHQRCTSYAAIVSRFAPQIWIFPIVKCIQMVRTRLTSCPSSSNSHLLKFQGTVPQTVNCRACICIWGQESGLSCDMAPKKCNAVSRCNLYKSNLEPFTIVHSQAGWKLIFVKWRALEYIVVVSSDMIPKSNISWSP